MSVTEKRGFGLIPDTPDQRDYLYHVSSPVLKALPDSVDLTPQLPQVYDQGSLGSCVGFATGSALEFLQKKQKSKSFTHSQLFIYYNARKAIGTVNEDSGSVIRDAFKSVNKDGSCPGTLWPYVISKFTQKPPIQAYTEAKKHQMLQYMRVDRNLETMKGCLAEGYPFVIGFSVYDSFMNKEMTKTGVGQLPKRGERLLGGHAVLCVGYSEKDQRFIFRNSWSDQWGQKGNFTFPYAYLLDDDLSSDFWTARMIEGTSAPAPQPKPEPPNCQCPCHFKT